MSDDDAAIGRSGATADGPTDATHGRLRTWLLLDADRRLVAAAQVVALFAAFVALGILDPVGLRAAMAAGDPVGTTFQAFIAAIVTGVTVVVAINQLVLSQELGAVGDQRERMRGAMEFRRDVEAALDRPVAPAEPAAFLRALLDETRGRAEAAASAAAEAGDPDRRERVERYVERLAADAAATSDRLDGARFGSFEVLSAALGFDYSVELHRARRLARGPDGAAPGDAVAEALDRVVDALELFGPAREHVKTLYFQWALIDLSRAVLYAALPALVVATGMTLYAGAPGSLPGSTLGVDDAVWVASGAAAVSLLPFAVLSAYILRVATVAKRTLAIGPFVLRETDSGGGE